MASEENPTENVPANPSEGEGTFKEPISKLADPVSAEEAKLKAKYPNIRPVAGGSALLQKRIQKGQKYFDSGDYQMAKQRGPGVLSSLRGPAGARNPATGDAIPTPESVHVRQLPLPSRPPH